MPQPLILTLKLDEETQEYFNHLRQKHFPPERNYLDAHLTMFHHLPGEELINICNTLEEISAEFSPFEIKFPNWRFLGKGVAADVEAKELLDLRKELAATWQDRLTRQDSQKFKPHITIQNKVEPEIAKRLFEEFSANEKPAEGCGKGLQLWNYLGGPWELESEFLF